MKEFSRHLVNPIALARCTVRLVAPAVAGGAEAKLNALPAQGSASAAPGESSAARSPVSAAAGEAEAKLNALPAGVATEPSLVDGSAGETQGVASATARVLDISFVRLVIEDCEPWTSLAEGAPVTAEFRLDRSVFNAEVAARGRGEGWLRLGFEKIVPSARAHLRSFLSPKKIGESLIEDWRNETIRHYHGLNESELWFNDAGGVLFTYLDQSDAEAQFIIRMSDARATLRVGKILRRDYMELNHIEADLPLIPLSDREIYAKLGECRDIVTNFRPSAQMEYNLQQRLLKVISDHLYSTSYRVERETPTRASLER